MKFQGDKCGYIDDLVADGTLDAECAKRRRGDALDYHVPDAFRAQQRPGADSTL